MRARVRTPARKTYNLPVAKTLSILIPVYNEKATVLELLRRVEAAPLPVAKQIILVDDGSTDGTREILQGLGGRAIVVLHERNLGKGAALRTALARATFDSLATERRYAERDWLPALDSLAAAGTRQQAALMVDALARREDLGRGERARLLLEDGERAANAGDDAAALSRFGAVEELVPDSAEAKSASVRSERIALRAARTDDEVAAIRERLSDLMQQGAAGAREAQPLLRLLDKADGLERVSATPDAFWYLRAELIRDSLRAPGLAAVDFAAMVERFPDSPWTPKGLVAAIAAGHPDADALRALLVTRYAESPYAVAASGGDAERYAVLEDSLQRALELAPAVRRGATTRPGANPAAAEPLDDDEPVGGRRPPPSTQPRPAQPRPPAPRPTTPPRPQPGARPTP